MYVPSAVPADTSELSEFLKLELLTISREIAEKKPFMLLQNLNKAPDKPRDGMIVKADGTNWNPGSGAGVYAFDGSVWNFLG